MIGAEVRYGLRACRQYPMQTVVALLAFGLGIGLTSTIYSIVYGTLLRGLPFAATLPSSPCSRSWVYSSGNCR